MTGNPPFPEHASSAAATGVGVAAAAPSDAAGASPGEAAKASWVQFLKQQKLKEQKEKKYSKRTTLNCEEGSLIQHEFLKTRFYGPCTVGGHKTTLCAPSCELHASGTLSILSGLL